jgi:hypothetical protein
MHTTKTTRRPLVVGAILVAALAAACSSAAAPSSPPSSAPSAAPSSGGDLPSDAPASTDPNGIVTSPPDPLPVDPGAGQPARVIPRPGQLNPRPVGASLLEPVVDGRRVIVKVTWTSGVEPCYVLDSVKVDRSGNAVALTLFEGSADANAICIEIAQEKATIVDLGELEPGTYTISSTLGDAQPVTVTVN